MSFKKKLSLYIAVITGVLAVPAIALAQGVANASANKFDADAMVAGAAAFVMAMGALGGTTAQGRATSAALEGIARQPSAAPRIQTPMILGLALIESLVLFSFVIAIMLVGKVGG